MTPLPASDIRGLLDRYERPLVRYAQSIVGDLESARDVVQDTFIRYVRKTSEQEGGEDETAMQTAQAITDDAEALKPAPLHTSLDPSDARHVEAWLFTVTRNRALDHVRKYSRIIAMPSEDPSPDEELAARDSADSLMGLLDALSANQREVVRLKFQNDLSYKEIADITGLTVTNVGFLLHVALKKLRTLLEETPLDSLPLRNRQKL
jgi:RNA polymerase sigma factor (sigma-70 family)